MDTTIDTDKDTYVAAVDSKAGLTAETKAVAKAAVAAANPPKGPLEISVASGGTAGWLVIRVAPYKRER